MTTLYNKQRTPSVQLKLKLTLQFIDVQHKPLLPRIIVRRWVKTAIFHDAEITLRFVNSIEGQALNHSYRGKNYATNVLTFSYTALENEPLQADIVLCPTVIAQEALAQKKTLLAHYAHLIIHGVLHAQGYDHEQECDAQQMEALEAALLTKLGFVNPYFDSQ